MNGFLNILKPPGMSSAAVVGAVRRLIGKEKAGHAGTLDPQAAGILPVMIGRAARLFDYLADKEKTYIAEIAFGQATDTQDAQGQIIAQSISIPSRQALEAILPQFVGQIRQTPSAFSAIKQNGRPLYDLARKGEKVDVPERTVHLHALTLMESMPNNGFMLRADCGRGTYIRTLCHDIGVALDCPAHMRFLLRTRTGAFDLDTAITLEEAAQLAQAGTLKDALIPMDAPLGHIPRVDVPESLVRAAKNGAKMPCVAFTNLPDEPFRLYIEDRFAGIAQKQEAWVRYRTMIYEENDACV